LGDPGVDPKIILKCLQEVGGGMDWIELAQDRNRWRALVNAIMNVRVQLNGEISLLAEKFSASQEGRCSLELVS
jgi:hypothetical protein